MMGSVETAILQAKQARLAGAWGYKTQLLKPEKIARAGATKYWTDDFHTADQREAFTKAGLIDYGAWAAVKAWCDDIGIEFLATPFDFEAVDALEGIGVRYYKIASGDIIHQPLIEYVARTGKHIFLSTGAAYESEVWRALDWVGDCEATVLACTLAYPTPPEAAHLSRILSLHRAFPGREIGYSDHTSMPETALAAAALGATTLEVHYTLDNDAPDVPDHKIAVNPKRLAAYVQAAELGATLRGDPVLRPVESERPARIGARRSLCAVRDLPRGHVLTDDDLIALRPGDGIPAFLMSEVVGKRLTAARAEGEPI